MGTPDLLLTIRYRDKTHTLTYAADSEAGRTIGRGDLQRWFGLPAEALINISKAHFTVVFKMCIRDSPTTRSATRLR